MITGTSLQKTTSHRVVIPFYVYAAISLLVACVLLFLNTDAFGQHHFHPKTLAIIHTMALGWGTMVILGASYQLVPVLVENSLYSEKLALLSFGLAAVGIPFLVYGFFVFNMSWPSIIGGIAINLSVITYVLNLGFSMPRKKKKNIHATFILAASCWLLLTTLLGLLLVINFNSQWLPKNSLQYLSLHAHMGIAGWFLMLVIGVGSRLIPMFMISKYTSAIQLSIMFWSLNLGIILFGIIDLATLPAYLQFLPACLVGTGILTFIMFCYKAYKQRIRKQIDVPMQISLLSVVIMIVPFIVLIGIIVIAYFLQGQYQMAILYGFFIFFGWLTAIILGMTFKTLPFIVWNKVYHKKASGGKTPTPKALFSEKIFRSMAISYVLGFICFAIGLITNAPVILKTGAALLILAAFLYNVNVQKIVFHKPAL